VKFAIQAHLRKIASGSNPAAGVAAIYGPGTNIPKAVREVLGLVRKVRKAD
jgi:methylmalonyl-CoA mutase cobalamin-binding subunit